MRINTPNRFLEKTHEGAPTARMTAEQALRRSVASCLLWESEFYEDGQKIADRILDLARQVPASTVAALAMEARQSFNLRHVPLLLLLSLIERGGSGVAETIERTIQRADELTELLAIYWKDGKRPLSAQMKKGLAGALRKFSEYSLAKYDRAGSVRLRDVLFITHAKPMDDGQAEIWKRLAENELVTPDTWEVALSGGADKKETFERLIEEGKLGYLALLRNLRNMAVAGCDVELVRDAIVARKNGAERVLPFRYIAAARAAPQFEPALDQALTEAIADLPTFTGKTVVLVDVSGSMDAKLSTKSDMTRMDAAAGLASIFPGDTRVFTFSDNLVEVPPRKGMAGVDTIVRSQRHNGTRLGAALSLIYGNVQCDRLVVITDEQSSDAVKPPKGLGYMINVASNKNGVGYGGWVHIDGFSESVLRFMSEYERE